jgi:hypothetical protein
MSKGSVEARDRQREMTMTGLVLVIRGVVMAGKDGWQWRGVRGIGGVEGEWKWLSKRNGNSRER